MHSLTRSGDRRIRTRSLRHLSVFVAILAFLALTASARAQGCAQCRDNAAATPPVTQDAYRHAIVLLVSAAGAIFIGTVLILKRSR